MSRILNVDDTQYALYARSRILKLAGYEVVEATTGSNAFSTAVREHPDLVILDVNLGDIDGLGVCRHLKSDPRTRGIPVLIVSAVRVTDLDAAAAASSGADFFASAPLSEEALLTLVRSLLARTAPGDGAREAAAQPPVGTEIDRDRLLTELAHELREPLQAAFTALDLLKRPDSDEALRERAHAAIERSVRAQACMVDDLLDLAGLNDGRPDGERIELGPLLERAVAGASPNAAQRNVKVTLSCKRAIGVRMDSARCSRLVANVIDAVVRSAKPDGRVSVACAAYNGRARVVVKDEARPVTTSLPAMSDPIAPESEGAASYVRYGLGLAMASHVVRTHGGALEVYDPGGGFGLVVAVSLPHAE